MDKVEIINGISIVLVSSFILYLARDYTKTKKRLTDLEKEKDIHQIKDLYVEKSIEGIKQIISQQKGEK